MSVILPPFIIKGAAAMKDDEAYIQKQLSQAAAAVGAESSYMIPPAAKRLRCMSSSSSNNPHAAEDLLLDMAARHQVLHMIGNVFSAKRSASISNWPGIHAHANMLFKPFFKFEDLFSTYESYMDASLQLGPVVVPG